MWVVTGDGDGLSIGGNHLLHTIRRNLDLQILLFNNRVYGLTKGQYSPTSRIGMKTKSSPEGAIDHPVDPHGLRARRRRHLRGAHRRRGRSSTCRTVLRRAHEHRGTAFIEILQNCPVYNGRRVARGGGSQQRVEAALVLEDGQPLAWGAEDQRRGIRIENGIPSIVHLGDEDPLAKGVAVHHERHESPAYAFALASLQRPDFPVPIGVFRAVEKAPYEAMLDEQVESSIRERGLGDLHALLHSGDTWTVGD